MEGLQLIVGLQLKLGTSQQTEGHSTLHDGAEIDGIQQLKLGTDGHPILHEITQSFFLEHLSTLLWQGSESWQLLSRLTSARGTTVLQFLCFLDLQDILYSTYKKIIYLQLHYSYYS